MLSSNPLVTVGVASYNNGRYIYETLESIRAQTYQHIELIIIDDCSVDNSVQVIQGWMHDYPELNVRFIRHLRNRGVCAVCNAIVAQAKGEYLTMVGSDDVYLPRKVEQQIELFRGLSADYCLVYSDMYIIDEYGNEARNTQLHSKEPNFLPIEGDIFDLLISLRD